MTEVIMEWNARGYGNDFGDAPHVGRAAQDHWRPLVQVELRRKLTSAECGYMIELAKGMSPKSDSLLQYYVAVRERSVDRLAERMERTL